MKNLEKIFKWLTTFKDEERKQFKNWINRLSSQRKNRTRKLVDYIWKCIDSNEAPTVEEVAKRIYGKTTYDRKQLNNYLLKTWDVIEEFLVHHYYLSDRNKRLNALHDLARNRKLQDEFEELNQTFLTDNTLHIGSEGYFRKYMLQSKNYFSEWNTMGKVKKTRAEFKELEHSLEQAYLISKLQLLCEAATRKSVSNDILNFELEIKTREQALEYKEENPIIFLYLQVYDLLKGYAQIELQELKDLFIFHHKLLDEQEQLQLLISITNHLISEYTESNNLETLKRIHEFYKLRLEYIPFDTYEEVSSHWFINQVNIAMNTGNMDWAKMFIEKYNRHLPIENREVVAQLSKGMILHKEGYFIESYNIFKNLKNRDIYITIRIQTYKIMCLVDYSFLVQNDREIVREACNTFKRFLKRNDEYIGDDVQKLYSNFIKFVQKLMVLECNLAEIKKELESTSAVGAPNWLKRKIEFMQKNRSKYII